MAIQWGSVMAMHNTNSLLKYAVPVVIVLVIFLLIKPLFHSDPEPIEQHTLQKEGTIKNNADKDSAAESLETLTAELSGTRQAVSEVAKNNDVLKKQNAELMDKLNAKESTFASQFSNEIQELKNQIGSISHTTSDYTVDGAKSAEAITTVNDLSHPAPDKNNPLNMMSNALSYDSSAPSVSTLSDAKEEEEKLIPYYTIPANGTSVKDRLMTALVGRIAIKGIVTDPYPFKIVISDDNLAANGLRVPHLLQMIVSGYCEGDLNLMSVRGWITSLTFVFDDGTISTTTSNDNDIGNFTKSNSLGYLSDEYGNPFIRGKLITNAPTYLGGNIALGAATGAANAYAQQQTTTNSSVLGGTSTSTVTGSPAKFVAGQSAASGMNEASEWWHDRQQQSFDAVYVSTVDEKNQPVNIAVNFAKEIHIDYNKKGRKLSYEQNANADVRHHLD